jgi:UDP-glucuronate decarboxylase
MKNKKILVIGGAGFIGSTLCKKLLSLNNSVICIDDLSTGKTSNIADIENNRFVFRKMDLLSLEPNDITTNLDYVFNLACPASPEKYQIDPVRTLETCFIGTYNALKIAKNSNANFIFTSTSEVYGDPLEHPQSEDYRGNVNTIGPRSCYDEGKRVAETLIMEYCKKYDLNYSIARIFNTYGEHMDENDGRVISNFVKQVKNHNEITIYGDGSQTRSFCHVSDMVEGLISLADNDINGPINLGNPEEYTILDVAKLVCELWDYTTDNIVYKDLPIDDPTKRKPNIDKAILLLNWEPKVSLRNGLLLMKN